MSFPENVNNPSRTIMATRSASTREAIIYNNFDKENQYRLPTIREAACLMGFPLSYQFEGKSENIKYKLIGNAVCCPLASCFAKEILIKEELSLDIKKVYIPKVKFNLNGQKFVKK